MVDHELTLRCPRCAQTLVLPTHDLSRRFRCPRCATEHIASDLVDTATPVPAVPLSDRPARANDTVIDEPPDVPDPLPQDSQVSDLPGVTAAAPSFESAKRGNTQPITLRLPVVTLPANTETVPPVAQPHRPIAPAAPLPPVSELWGASTSPVVPPPQPPPVTSTVTQETPAPQPAPNAYAFAYVEPPERQRGWVTAGVDGAAVAGRFANQVLTVSADVDRWLQGRKAKLAAGILIVVALASISEATAGIAVVVSFMFLLLVILSGLALIASLREEDGAWSFAAALRRAKQWIELLPVVLMTPFSLSWPHRFMMLGATSATVGMAGLVFQNLLLVSSPLITTLSDVRPRDILAAAESAQAWSWFLLVAGGAVLLTALWKLRNPDAPTTPVATGDPSLDVVRSVLSLPLVIDARAMRGAFPNAHPLVSGLLAELAEWRPRRCFHEDEYQGSLHRHLLRRLPDSKPRREFWISSPEIAEPGRVDFLIGGCIVVEMKKKIAGSLGRDAIGQLQLYLRIRRQDGPVLLLLCGDAPHEFEGSVLASALQELRNQGAAIAVIKAGVRAI